MKQSNSTDRKGVLLAAVLIAAAVMLPLSDAKVLARDGSDDTPAQRPTTQTTTTQPKTETERHVSDMQTVAQKEVEQEKQRKGAKVLSEEKRKLVCENRQNAINNKLAAFNQTADKHLTKLNETFAKVQAYQAAHNLSVANYAELVTTATEKQQAATTAVAALKTVAVNVDCTNPETVVKLATVRDAAKTARTALHDYRMAIKAIVVALAQAQDGASSDDASSNTIGGTQ